MQARIFQRPKNAMQSGKALTSQWVLDFVPAEAKRPDPLMGWQQTRDTDGQIRLKFDTREEAVAYAQNNGIPFEVTEPKLPKKIIKAYADNFAANRKQPWTH